MPRRQSVSLDWSHRELNGNRFFTQDDQCQGVTTEASADYVLPLSGERTLRLGYGQYETPLGPWTRQSGLRLEQTNVQTLQVTCDVRGAYGYFRACPSLNLDLRLSEEAYSPLA